MKKINNRYSQDDLLLKESVQLTIYDRNPSISYLSSWTIIWNTQAYEPLNSSTKSKIKALVSYLKHLHPVHVLWWDIMQFVHAWNLTGLKEFKEILKIQKITNCFVATGALQVGPNKLLLFHIFSGCFR